jgi:hypothetical protein
MAKVAVALRLGPETLERVDALARVWGRSRQAVLESFVLDGLGLAGRGVVDVPEPQTVTEVVEPAKAAARIERELSAKPAAVRPQVHPGHVVERPNLTRDEIRRAEEEYRAAIWARQQKLNEAKARASR